MREPDVLELDVTLNIMGYDWQDLTDLFVEPFDTVYRTKIGFRWYPSAVGHSQITLLLIIASSLGGITSGLLNQIGADIYQWVKYSLSKVLARKKQSFDESAIILKFDDKSVTIHINDKRDIIEVLENISDVINWVKDDLVNSSDSIDVSSADINCLES